MAKAESCFHCVYSRWDRNQAVWMMGVGMPATPMCANQEDYPGRWKECPFGRVCRNFRPRPPTPKGETVKTIPLGDGYYAYVDAADYEWLSRWTWHLQNGYAVRREKKKLIFMHREIMQPPPGMVVDHKYRNKLDNTRDRLLVCTQQENCYNRTRRNGSSSRFHGVSYSRSARKWVARITFRGRRLHLGCFDEEIEAARAYDRAAVALFGEFTRLNFPEEWPPERTAEVHAQRDAVLRSLKERKAKNSRRRAEARARRTENRRRPKSGGRQAKSKRGKTAQAVARKPVGATHASPARGRGNKAKKKHAKTPKRPAPRVTSHRSRATASKERRTHDAKRTTKSPPATSSRSRDTKTRQKRGRRTRPA